jgi:hypothetical protein
MKLTPFAKTSLMLLQAMILLLTMLTATVLLE